MTDKKLLEAGVQTTIPFFLLTRRFAGQFNCSLLLFFLTWHAEEVVCSQFLVNYREYVS
jgi:hypothetical protein